MTSEEFISLYGKHLNEQQLKAVESVDGPVLLLAVPGSGKTTVLVTRIGYMILCKNISAKDILVLTYTIAATKDMGQRFASIFGEELASEVEFRTINGICAKIIQTYGRSIGKEPFELVTDEKELNRIVNDILADILEEYPTENDVRVIKTWITYCKNMMLDEDEIKDIGEREKIPLLETFDMYNQYLTSNRLMDYDDQMTYAHALLKDNPALLAHYRSLFKYICVDEAQDTSRIQHEIIALLSGTNGNLFMVGDEDQSIYGFRAAYPEALLDFEKTHSAAKVLVLTRNYRSNAQIVELADYFIQKNKFRHPKVMEAIRAVGSDTDVIEMKYRSNQYNYLLKVAKNCYHETAVLYRLNESCIPLVDLLERNRVPYRIKGLEMTFFTHRVVQDVFNIMRLARNPFDTNLFLKVYYKIQTFISKYQAKQLCEYSQKHKIPILDAAQYVSGISRYLVGKCKSASTHLKNMLNESPDKAINRIVNFMGYKEYMSNHDMDWNKITILRNLAFREQTIDSFEKRVGYLYNLLKNKQPNYSAKFILSTIHSAKGLEYDEVYLMDVCNGVFPMEPTLISNPQTITDKKLGEEERRLLYVAVTRAKNCLHVFRFETEKSVLLDELLNPSVVHQRIPERREIIENTKKDRVEKDVTSSIIIGKSVLEPPREPKCGDQVFQVAYGNGEIIEVGLNNMGKVKDFSVLFESGSVREFGYPIAFSKGMYYKKVEVEKVEEVDSSEEHKLLVEPEPAEEQECDEKAQTERKIDIQERFEDNNELFNKLKAKRKEISARDKTIPFYIMTDKTLLALAEIKPRTKEEFLSIKGIKEVKYEKYGREFLDVILSNSDGKGSISNQVITKKGRKKDFCIIPEDVAKFNFREYMYGTEIRDELNRITTVKRIKKVTYSDIWKVLVSKEYVEEVYISGVMTKRQTEIGKKKGIISVSKESTRGSVYLVLMYPIVVQKEIVEHYIQTGEN